MKRKKINSIIFLKRILLLFGLVFTSISFSQSIKTSVDTTTIKIGEEIKLKFDVELDSFAKVTFPKSKVFGLLEVIESYKADTIKKEGKYTFSKTYGITQFDKGNYTIPSQKITINNRTFYSDSVLVEVNDVAVDTTKQNMYDIKPIIDVEEPEKDFPFWIGFVLLGIVILGVFLFRTLKNRPKKEKEKQKKIPPFEEAIEHLTKLDNSNLLETSQYKAYYSELTEVLKKYLEEEVYNNALEQTSDELVGKLHLLRDSGELPLSKEILNDLEKVLRQSDLVKFAKSKPDQGTARADRTTIESMINETKRVLPEPAEEDLLFNEEYRQNQEKKQKRKIILLSGLGVFVLFVLMVLVLGYKYGFDTVKDNVFGHPSKELLEQEKWINSAYGDPAIVIKTPKVLERVSGIGSNSSNVQRFAYGTLGSNFCIEIASIKIPDNPMFSLGQTKDNGDDSDESEIDLEAFNEETLNGIEARGATNILVKQEEYDNGKSLTGIKAYGTLSASDPVSGEVNTFEYQILSFSQGKSIQQVLIFHKEEDKYSKQIIDKVLDSVQLKTKEE